MAAYFNMYKKFIAAGRTSGMEEKLASLLGFGLLTVDEYETLMQMLTEKAVQA